MSTDRPPVYSSYNPAHYAALFAVEDRHFWFRARNRVIAALAGRTVAGLPPGYRVLEVGCGTGNVLKVLRQVCREGRVYGLDQHAEGLRLAGRRTDAARLQGDLGALPFGNRFEVIGMFDVLEHLPDDVGVIAGLRRCLAPGGALLLTVPAHRWLWSYFDEASHHCRRYALGELKRTLEQAGYRVDYLSHYMTAVLPMAWLGRRMAAWALRMRGGRGKPAPELVAGDLRMLPVLNAGLAWGLGLEAFTVARGSRLPFGASLVALARNADGARP